MIGVVGAGAIGCYVGGRLAAGGSDVTFVSRPRIADEVRKHGLRLSDYRGADLQVAQSVFATDVTAVAEADLILVTVKSAATADVATALAPVIRPDAVVLSLQNGLRNADVLDQTLGRGRAIAGMVPFNVVHRGDGMFHQASEGELEAAADPRLHPFGDAFRAAGLPLLLQADMAAVLWAKLLLNLNNPVNALSGLPLQEELGQRDFRRCLALAQQEALEIMAAAAIVPARITPVPPRVLPRLLGVPDVVFRRLASRMLEIDPHARSSMADDLALGRLTEIDWINGEVTALAASVGRSAPVNARLVELIRDAEQGRVRRWSGGDLLADLRRAHAS